MFKLLLRRAVAILERVLAALLVLLIALGLVGLGVAVFHLIQNRPYLDTAGILSVLDHVLAIFILIELFAIGLAYIAGKRVIRTVLEASLVAVCRKLIAFEATEHALERGLALAALLLAVALSWYLLSKTGLWPRGSAGSSEDQS
jgi:uncharacterized membrane protein (DUF373 family)